MDDVALELIADLCCELDPVAQDYLLHHDCCLEGRYVRASLLECLGFTVQGSGFRV